MRARAASSTRSGNSIPVIEAATFSGGPARAGAMLAGSCARFIGDRPSACRRNHEDAGIPRHGRRVADMPLETGHRIDAGR